MTVILNPWQFWPYLSARHHLCYFESLNLMVLTMHLVLLSFGACLMLTNYMCSCMLNGKDHQANKAC